MNQSVHELGMYQWLTDIDVFGIISDYEGLSVVFYYIMAYRTLIVEYKAREACIPIDIKKVVVATGQFEHICTDVLLPEWEEIASGIWSCGVNWW